MLFLWEQEQDASANEHEEALVANGVHARTSELEQVVAGQAIWDDVIAHLNNQPDSAWADINVGQFLSFTGGFENAFVVDGRDQPTSLPPWTAG